MKLTDFILNNPKLNQISSSISQSNIYKSVCLKNASDNYLINQVTNYYLKTDQNVIFITSNIYKAQQAYDKFLGYLGKEVVSFFPGEEFVTLNSVASSSVFKLARMNTIENILNNKRQLIVTNIEGITKRVLSKDRLIASILNIKVNDIYNKQQLVNDLIVRGYTKCGITTSFNEFSERGEVVDIYSINLDKPIRINYFDDEIESIKYFDSETQLSISSLDEVLIYPVNEITYDNPEGVSKRIQKKYQDEYSLSMIDKVINYQDVDSLYIYLDCIDEDNQPILDLIDNKIIFFEQYDDVLRQEDEQFKEIKEYLKEHDIKFNSKFFLPIKDLIKDDLKVYTYTNEVLNTLGHLDNLIDCKTIKNVEYSNNLKAMFDEIQTNINNHIYILTHEDSDKLKLIEESILLRGLSYEEFTDFDHLIKSQIYVLTLPLFYGYHDLDNNIQIITPLDYSNKNKTTSFLKQYYKVTSKIYNKDDLEIGDYVVHENHGIGIYKGIQTLTINNNLIDYLTIEYADNSTVKIPVENIYMLSKYIGSKETLPRLDSISKKTWERKRKKVEKSVSDLAQRLIKMEEERAKKVGFIYPEDSVYQKEFESEFGYNETIDQLKAIEDVKRDLMSGVKMDRVICGDVGFGKTEVAMRGAFKVVEGGKQVAYLAPTTVLTRQHYNTFKERFEKYGIKVALLNRYVTPSETKQILKELKSGYIDIIIGTHRILSSDVEFKDLGLLIIDEEQRFGVEHKERFRELKADINVLSLSATPIPRTLQMSLVGIKDLSLIETAPVNRYPIQTYVMEENQAIIREAINRELGRGGQVFYLLNRIDELEGVVPKLQASTPHARIGLIHGKLTKERIEDIIDGFLNKTIDVLLCTTIVETGIDIPNANTIIIEKADILGLSQLYQIRGRVGRSDKLAYAYLLYKKEVASNLTAMKRLNTIKEFTTLGSGYKIAMRDLTIRGAGDILGKEQSGFIDDVGINTYLKILQTAVEREKGQIKPELKHYRINNPRHIDALYINDDGLRIEAHKQINNVTSRIEEENVIAEFNDRYGKVDPDILLYIEAKYLEYLLNISGVESFRETTKEVEVVFNEVKSKDIFNKGLKLLEYLSEIHSKIKTSKYLNKAIIRLNRSDYQTSYIYELNKILEFLNK